MTCYLPLLSSLSYVPITPTSVPSLYLLCSFFSLILLSMTSLVCSKSDALYIDKALPSVLFLLDDQSTAVAKRAASAAVSLYPGVIKVDMFTHKHTHTHTPWRKLFVFCCDPKAVWWNDWGDCGGEGAVGGMGCVCMCSCSSQLCWWCITVVVL